MKMVKFVMEKMEKLSSHFVRAINGRTLKAESAIGRCHSVVHPGYVTRKIMDEHNCLKKNDGEICKSFKRVQSGEYNFWVGYDRGQRHKADEKLRIKQMKEDNKLKEKSNHERLNYVKDLLSPYGMCVTHVAEEEVVNVGARKKVLLKICYRAHGHGWTECPPEAMMEIKRTFGMPVRLAYMGKVNDLTNNSVSML